MKEYPKIYGFDKAPVGQPCIAFRKIDGSNLRFSYSAKQRKWYKFGTRRHLFLEGDPEYGAAIPVFFAKYAEGIAKVFHDNWRTAQDMTVYGEYFGPHSFSGQHDCLRLGVESNDPKDLVVFDINIHKKGFLGPEEFLKYFGHLPVADVVYRGPLTDEFFHDVRNGKYDVDEGVVCKWGEKHNLGMCKIKTLAYLEKLKKHFGDKWKDGWE